MCLVTLGIQCVLHYCISYRRYNYLVNLASCAKCFHFCITLPPLGIFHCALPTIFCILLLLLCLSPPPFFFHSSLFLTSSLRLSSSQGLSLCHMTNGTTTSRPGCVMQWMSLPQPSRPWRWTECYKACLSQAALGHLTKKSPARDTPRKSWSESVLLWRGLVCKRKTQKTKRCAQTHFLRQVKQSSAASQQGCQASAFSLQLFGNFLLLP